MEECRTQLRRLLGKQQQHADDDIALPFLQYFNTWRTVPQVESLARHVLAPWASQLLDVPSVRLYQDSVFWKRGARWTDPVARGRPHGAL